MQDAWIPLVTDLLAEGYIVLYSFDKCGGWISKSEIHSAGSHKGKTMGRFKFMGTGGSSHQLFFSFVLRLVSLAHRMLHTEVSHLALQTRLPQAKWLLRQLSSAGPVQRPCTRHLNPRWRWQAVGRSTAPGTAVWSWELHSCLNYFLKWANLQRIWPSFLYSWQYLW